MLVHLCLMLPPEQLSEEAIYARLVTSQVDGDRTVGNDVDIIFGWARLGSTLTFFGLKYI